MKIIELVKKLPEEALLELNALFTTAMLYPLLEEACAFLADKNVKQVDFAVLYHKDSTRQALCVEAYFNSELYVTLLFTVDYEFIRLRMITPKIASDRGHDRIHSGPKAPHESPLQ